MVRFRRRFVFLRGSNYRLRGRQYRVGSSDARTLKLLAEIYDSCSACTDRSWPFQLRSQIRRIQRLSARRLLNWVAERTDDPTLRVLAIWLRGRCGGSLGTSSLARFSTHPDDQTRKEVARCLKRMGAWVQLREMADHDANPRIRRMATAQPPKPFRRRLADFSNRFPRQEIRSIKRRLFVSPEADVGQGRPPKSRWIIRMVLERIHRIVAGESR